MNFSINIVRSKSRMTPEGTPGTLNTSADTPFTCDTLELQWADNQPGVSCIKPDPDGGSEAYNAYLWYSPTLGRTVVRLEDKYGRTNCLLHNGNWAGEGEGDITQVHGCTELGQGYAKIQRPDGNMQFGILNSGKTVDALVSHITNNIELGASFLVTYSWGV